MFTSSKKTHLQLTRYFRVWHKRFGILTAFFLIFLSISGIALNHTNELSLVHKAVNNTWLLNHYGIKDPNRVHFYQNNTLIITNNYAWLNNTLLYEVSEKMISMGLFNQMILLLTDSSLYVFTNDGELIDKLDSLSGLPSSISGMSIGRSSVVVNTNNGYYQTDSDLLEWEKVQSFVQPNWINESTPSKAQLKLAKLQYKSQLLSWERIIVDMHSGRFFGYIGVLLMDLIALLLIMLSVTGLYIWLKNKSRK